MDACTSATAAEKPDCGASRARDTGWRRFLRYEHRGRSLPMDMLRGIAILLVLGRHYVVAPADLGLMQPLAGSWTTIGWAGVDLFFVLSGFLVSGLIFAEFRQRGGVDVRRFVIRRGFKIWPPYLAYVAVVASWLGWQQWAGRSGSVWAQLWPNVLHVQNYFHTPRLHTWSLAVEEHFYLAVAFAFYWLLRRRNVASLLRGLPTFILGCVVALAALRHAAFLRHGAEQLNLYATHLRFDGLLIGTLLAYWTHFEPEKLQPVARRPLSAIALGIAVAAPTLALSPEANAWTAGVGLMGVYVGFALVVIGWMNASRVHAGWRRAWASTPAAMLGHIGFYSYSIYLWHVDLAQTPLKHLVPKLAALEIPAGILWLAATSVYVLLAVIGGALLSRALEIPSLALRDRLFPSAVKPAIVAAPANVLPSPATACVPGATSTAATAATRVSAV